MRFFLMLTIYLLVSCANNSVQHSSDKTMHSKKHKSSMQEYKQVLKSRNDMQDSAPKGPHPTAFKEVKPVSEPLSRYGNPATYHVNGHTYEVLNTSHGYRAQGLASWYGTKFHKKRTSSGEEYDLYALTAAHKTLPLPTYVRVKNLKNGREAIIKVNDRGPFHEGRILDLSYGAALKLGILPEGTALVQIEALNTNKAHGHRAHYYLQAGAFSSRAMAESLRHKIIKLTPSPTFIEQYNHYFIVKVGPFAERKMTEDLKTQLAKQGVHDAFSVLQ